MHVSAHLDVDLVALGADDDVTCLLRVVAPTPPATAARPGQALVVVLDRSGSMAGRPLEGAVRAIQDIVRRLAPQDAFGLVVFDGEGHVVVPARTMAQHDRSAVERAIASVRPGGTTDLSSGYLLGLREASRILGEGAGPVGATVLVVSDGHANAGIVDPDRLADVAATARREARVTTGTLGWGTEYDAVLLTAITAAGEGDHRFAADVDEGVRALADAAGDLVDKSVLGTVVRVRPQDGLVDAIALRRDLPNHREPDGLVVALGDLYAGEERTLLVGLHVPAREALGVATIATIELTYTALPELRAHTVTLPIAINVVPGDEARHRVPDPHVQVESLLADVDRAKRSTADLLREGEAEQARRTIDEATSRVRAARTSLSDALTEDVSTALDEELETLERLREATHDRPALFAEKTLMEDWNRASRGRKRRPPRSEGASSDAGTSVDDD